MLEIDISTIMRKVKHMKSKNGLLFQAIVLNKSREHTKWQKINIELAAIVGCLARTNK